MSAERRCLCPSDCACQAPDWMLRTVVCGCRQHDESCRLRVYEWHTECSPRPRYTDGTEVHPGDAVRFRQAPGGILPPSPDWKYGKAVVSAHCSGTLDLSAEDGRRYNLLGHIIERVAAKVSPDVTIAAGSDLP